MSDALLQVRGLRTVFGEGADRVTAVDGVDLTVEPGETVCLVGESGSGKTVTCESITGLTEGRIVDGEVVFDGQELTTCAESQLRRLRGNRIASVFQNPQNALDPVRTVRAQLVAVLQRHRDLEKAVARSRAVALLDRVGIPEPAARATAYPHEFSGGMRQRVLIAMALAGDPDLLVADEPTTALDVTTEAGILELLAELQDERDLAVLFVTHDLGVVSEIADEVIVLYGGAVMERGPSAAVFDRPLHPYTRGLLRSLPGQGEGFNPLPGEPPDPADLPDGCRFHPRCPHAQPRCRTDPDPLTHEVGSGQVACVFYDPDADLDPATLDDVDGQRRPEADADAPALGVGTNGAERGDEEGRAGNHSPETGRNRSNDGDADFEWADDGTDSDHGTGSDDGTGSDHGTGPDDGTGSDHGTGPDDGTDSDHGTGSDDGGEDRE